VKLQWELQLMSQESCPNQGGLKDMLQAYAEGLDILRNAQSKDLLEDQAKNAHRGRELGGELQSGSDHA